MSEDNSSLQCDGRWQECPLEPCRTAKACGCNAPKPVSRFKVGFTGQVEADPNGSFVHYLDYQKLSIARDAFSHDASDLQHELDEEYRRGGLQAAALKVLNEELACLEDAARSVHDYLRANCPDIIDISTSSELAADSLKNRLQRLHDLLNGKAGFGIPVPHEAGAAWNAAVEAAANVAENNFRHVDTESNEAQHCQHTAKLIRRLHRPSNVDGPPPCPGCKVCGPIGRAACRANPDIIRPTDGGGVK